MSYFVCTAGGYKEGDRKRWLTCDMTGLAWSYFETLALRFHDKESADRMCERVKEIDNVEEVETFKKRKKK